MFSKIFALAAVALPTVLALTVDTPTDWKGNQTNSVSWTTTPSDPTVFSIQLVNTQFHNTFALANNVQATQGSLAIPLPQLTAGPNFVLQFFAINNQSDIFASSQSFTIQEQDSSSVSTTATAASTASGSAGGTPTTLSASTPSVTTPVVTPSTTSSSTQGPITVSDTSSTDTSSTGASASSPATSTGASSANTVISGALFAVVAGLVGVTGL